MDKRFLLTYSIEGNIDFQWFDTEEELEEFITNDRRIEVFDAIEIYQARNIIVED